MSRKQCRRRHTVALAPRGLRAKLSRSQQVDLGLAHLANLDAIARGAAGEEVLWQWVGAVLTWSYVATVLELGSLEMQLQLQLVMQVVERYGRTGRVLFSGPDYQAAKEGVDAMDELAARVDRETAIAAATWSESRITDMVAGIACRATCAALRDRKAA
jgi:hypothetical protein